MSEFPKDFPILLVVSIAQTDFCDPPASESQHSLGIWKATWTTVGAEEGTRLARKGERVVIISWVCLSWDLPSSFRGEHISPASWLQKLWLPGTACIKDSLKNRCSVFFSYSSSILCPFLFLIYLPFLNQCLLPSLLSFLYTSIFFFEDEFPGVLEEHVLLPVGQDTVWWWWLSLLKGIRISQIWIASWTKAAFSRSFILEAAQRHPLGCNWCKSWFWLPCCVHMRSLWKVNLSITGALMSIIFSSDICSCSILRVLLTFHDKTSSHCILTVCQTYSNGCFSPLL